MHSFYLRSLYGQNQLARGEMEVAGNMLSLADVKSDVYLVGAVNDHIVPWPSSDKATGLLGGNVRYVPSSGGHIAGIVNPPGPKSWYEAGEHYPGSATQWRQAAEKHDGSWWADWAAWAGARAGCLGPPPPVGSERYPALAEAPATSSIADSSPEPVTGHPQLLTRPLQPGMAGQAGGTERAASRPRRPQSARDLPRCPWRPRGVTPVGRTRYARSGDQRIAYELRGVAAVPRRPTPLLIQGLGFDRAGWGPAIQPPAAPVPARPG